MKLYLIRHGKTEWNQLKRMQGKQDSPLTQEGVLNAEALAEKLSDIKFDYIYSSSCGRAYKTAQILNKYHNKKIIKSNSLQEIALGDWEGCLMSDLEISHKEQQSNFWNAPHKYNPAEHNGESFFEVRKRVIEKIENIIQKHKTGNVMIVAHTVVLKSILHHILDKEIKELWDQPAILPTSLSIIEVVDNKPTIKVIASMSHAVTTEKGSNGLY